MILIKKNKIIKAVYLYLKSLLYRGNTKYCPCCDKGYRKFLPARGRISVCCPGCGSMERHRAVYIYLKNNTNFFKYQGKVLHFAPEYCFQKKFNKNPNLEYYTADLSSHEAKYKIDITNIDFKNNFFDVIICLHVLEHIKNDRKAIMELYRILKPKGWAIIQCPIDLELEKTYEDFNIVTPEEQKRLFGAKGHVRIYGRDFKDRLKQGGFKVKVERFIENFKENTINRYGLNKKDLIYFCTK